MAGNTLLTLSRITYESALILRNSLKLGALVNRTYNNQFAQTGAKAGQTVNLRKPPRYVGRSGPVAKFEGMNEQYVPLTLLPQFGVDLTYTSADMTLSIDNFRDRFLLPAVTTVANKIDADGLALVNGVPWMVGTPGTVPNDLLTYMTAGAILSEEAAPRDDLRSLLLNPISMATIANANKTLFNPQTAIGEQYRTGLMSQASGWMWYEDQNILTHTVGPLGGTPLVNGAGQTGSSLVTDGWTASAAARLNVGDVFTIAGVYAVNPQSRLNTGRLRQFVVGSAVSSDGSGNATIPIYPPITPPDNLGNPVQFQTVTAAPADNAALTVIGAANAISPQNIGFYRDAIALAMVDLEVPRGAVEVERVSDEDMGVSIRIVHFYDGVSDISGARLDVLYAYALIYPELCVRIAA